MIDRGKGDEERQDTGASRYEEGDDDECKEGAQGPWKAVAAATSTAAPIQPSPVPEPGVCAVLLTKC